MEFHWRLCKLHFLLKSFVWHLLQCVSISKQVVGDWKSVRLNARHKTWLQCADDHRLMDLQWCTWFESSAMPRALESLLERVQMFHKKSKVVMSEQGERETYLTLHKASQKE